MKNPLTPAGIEPGTFRFVYIYIYIYAKFCQYVIITIMGMIKLRIQYLQVKYEER